LIDSEDSFFDFIKSEVESRGEDFISLLSHVDLLCLSRWKMDEYLEIVNSNTLTLGIWERIGARLREAEFTPLVRSVLHTSRRLRFIRPGCDHFDGIFSFLKQESGGNCLKNNTIAATASNTSGGALHYLFDKSDYGQTAYWQHGNVLNGYFEIDFKDRRLAMTHYSIHNSLDHVSEYHFLKTWTVEGSNDGKEWTVIDSRRNEESLHGKDKVEVLFACNGDTQHEFRFIRLYQRGLSHDPQYYHFLISQFEVFGTLYSTKQE
jgi:hypothetical protein